MRVIHSVPGKTLKPNNVKKLNSLENLGFNKKKNTRFDLLKSLSETVDVHPWTSATLSAIGRSVVGAGWKLVKHELFKDQASDEDRNRINEFLIRPNRNWDNIKDYATFSTQIYQTVGSFILFGQFAWEIIRDGNGRPVGFDVLSGFLEPNVNPKGYFKSPNFIFYPWDESDPVNYKKEDVIYAFHPGITGKITGKTAYESLLYTSIPADLYAAVSYRELFSNVNAPYNGVWEVDESVSDEDFEFFASLLDEKYSGVENYGRNPLLIRGKAKFNPITSRHHEDAPYLDGRRYNQEEISAVTGVDGNKLGLTQFATKANLRESRREFHENTMRPIYNFLEESIYTQVMLRILGVQGWKLEFERPDFATALEQATIDMRYISMGVDSPNEVRIRRGQDPREGGDVYFEPQNMDTIGSDGELVREEDGEEEPQGTDNAPERPPRDEEQNILDTEEMIQELSQWRTFTLRAMDGKRKQRDFVTYYLPDDLAHTIKTLLKNSGDDFSYVKEIFDTAIDILENGE